MAKNGVLEKDFEIFSWCEISPKNILSKGKVKKLVKKKG